MASERQIDNQCAGTGRAAELLGEREGRKESVFIFVMSRVFYHNGWSPSNLQPVGISLVSGDAESKKRWRVL